MRRTRIIGTGHFVPDRVVTNDDLATLVDTSAEWIRTRTGICERRILEHDRATSDMAVIAGRRAMEAAAAARGDIQLVIVATVTPDMPMPACAALVQAKLGLACPAFDLSAACAGFTYGLAMADALIRSHTYECILFIGAEALSRVTNWQDRGTCVLFGDGAGAVVLCAEDWPSDPPGSTLRGVLAIELGADGNLADDLSIESGGSREPASLDSIRKGGHFIAMKGRTIFSNAVRHMSESAARVIAKAGLTLSDVDLVIPHQSNLRILESVAKRLGLPMARMAVNIGRVGNTSSASIPIALDELARQGRLREGMNLLMTGLGGGLTWGSVLYRW